MDTPDSPSSVVIGNTSDVKGIDCRMISIKASTSQIHQRRKDSMQESSSIVLSSSTYGVESSLGETIPCPHGRPDHRTLMASESQSSVGDSTDPSAGLFPLSQQSQTSMFLDGTRPRLILAWTLHFLSTVVILCCGCRANQGERKYIPIDVEKVAEDCAKAFVDVFASSMDDPTAFVCCRSTIADSSIKNPLICNPPPYYLPFGRRLARFPDAWLLPLFPLFVRGGWQLYCNYSGKAAVSKLDSLYAKRRLYLYLGLIQIRGWILYLAFDELEDLFAQSAGKNCWYEEYLHPNYHHCQGRMTDFSDHVVLYFSQILPIALIEILYSFSVPVPFWSSGGRGSRKSHIGFDPRMDQHQMIPIVLVLWLTNLYIVTFLGAFKTAAYFHTPSEVFMGFFISLLVQLPLCLLQCTSTFFSQREYFFGPMPP